MRNSRSLWLGGFACAVALVSTDAAAQQDPNRVTVAVNLALGSFWSDESHLGKGPIVGVAVRVQPWERWGFEFDTRRYTHERRFDTSGVVFAGSGMLFTGHVTHYLRTSGARPFLSAGIGVVRSEGENRFPIRSLFSGPAAILGEEVFHFEDTNAGLSVGGGVDVPLGDHWSLRPEAHSLWGAGAVLSPLDFGASLGFGW